MAESDLSDGIARQIVVYSTWTKEYSFPPGDYLLRVSQTEIDYGLNKNNKILNNDTKLIDSSIDQWINTNWAILFIYKNLTLLNYKPPFSIKPTNNVWN